MTLAIVTQDAVEVLEEVEAEAILTQVAVEVLAEVNSPLAIVTQLAVEILYNNPVFPHAVDVHPDQPEWSPAMLASLPEGQALNYASYWGVHNKETRLGDRRVWQTYVRR